jgi:hypothetical protein
VIEDLASSAEKRKRDCFDLLHWLWSCETQGQRLAASNTALWKALSGPEAAPRLHSQVHMDEHLLLVAMRNFLRALDRMPEMKASFALDPKTARAIEMLRDIYEHWDQYVDLHRAKTPFPKRSGKAFEEAYPERQPWSMVYGEDGPVLAGVIVLRDFFDSLGRFEPQARAAWSEAAAAEGSAPASLRTRTRE